MAEDKKFDDLVSSITDDVYPHGICPLISKMNLSPVDTGQIKLVEGRNQALMTMVSSPHLMPCIGDKCQLWDNISKECAHTYSHECMGETVNIWRDLNKWVFNISKTMERIEVWLADIYEQTHPT